MQTTVLARSFTALALVAAAAGTQSPIAGKPQVSGSPVRTHRGAVTGVAFTADGARALSVSMAGDASVWDAKTGARGQPDLLRFIHPTYQHANVAHPTLPFRR